MRRLSQAGVFTTLTMTTSLGVNDDEIGDVDSPRARHAVRRRRVDSAAVRLGAIGRDRSDESPHAHRRARRGSGRRRTDS